MEQGPKASRLLIVDDEPGIRGLLCGMLSRQGFTVIEAEDGAVAHDLFFQNPDGFDMVVTDIMMPGMDGIELGRRIRNLFPSFPILYLSAYAERNLPTDLKTAFVHKPFTPSSLIKLIRSLIA
jgi:CheY-like chemotaxis protein